MGDYGLPCNTRCLFTWECDPPGRISWGRHRIWVGCFWRLLTGFGNARGKFIKWWCLLLIMFGVGVVAMRVVINIFLVWFRAHKRNENGTRQSAYLRQDEQFMVCIGLRFRPDLLTWTKIYRIGLFLSSNQPIHNFLRYCDYIIVLAPFLNGEESLIKIKKLS